jgi:predicted Zn-dependent protease
MKWASLICGNQCKTDSEPTESLRDEAVSVVAMLRARGNIPYNVLPEIISSFNHMSDNMLLQVEQETVGYLKECGVDPSVMGNVVEKIHQHRQLLSFLETAYKQDKFFENHPLAVRPEPATLGSRVKLCVESRL